MPRKRNKGRGTRQELTAPKYKNALRKKRRFAQADDHIEKSNLFRQSKLYARKGQAALPRCSYCNQLFVLKCVPSVCVYRVLSASHIEITKVGRRQKHLFLFFVWEYLMMVSYSNMLFVLNPKHIFPPT